MTTPHQPAPDGAFVVGGGDYNFGQDYTNGIIRSLFDVPTAGFDNALDFFREHLLKLPLEALQKFQGMIPGATPGDFSSVTNAVTFIMDSLTDSALFLKEAVFEEFLGGAFQLVKDTLQGVQKFVQDLVDAILKAIRGIPIVGGSLADIIEHIGNLKSTAETAQQTAEDTAQGVIDGWTGTGPSTGGVYDTMQAIKTAVENGYTVDTTTSTTNWNRPAGLSEITVVGIGGGKNGTRGNDAWSIGTDFMWGGIGGWGGGFVAVGLLPSEVPSTVLCTIGVDGGETKFGSLVSTKKQEGNMALQGLGFTASTSFAGDGGNGGRGAGFSESENPYYPGTDGESSVVAAGGIAGTSSGQAGTAGGSAPINASTKCGGGGGAGGAGARSSNTGGAGGAGGYPGGGGGGGGGGRYSTSTTSTGTAGAGGLGGNGVMWIIYKAVA